MTGPLASFATQIKKTIAQPAPLRLLFVEDDEDFRQVLRVLLSRVEVPQPLESVFLSTVQDAQRVVDATRVDAIVSDYHLPDGTGVELLEHARRTAPDTQRVILTGHPEAAKTTKSFETSVQSLWYKGLHVRELQHRIERLVHAVIRPAA